MIGEDVFSLFFHFSQPFVLFRFNTFQDICNANGNCHAMQFQPGATGGGGGKGEQWHA
jgi:hypothetical protein